MDQRGRDNPPLFYIDRELNNGIYHVLLTEPVAGTNFEHSFNITKEFTTRTVAGQITTALPRGLYAFQNIKHRDNFLNRCNDAYNSEFGDDHDAICIAVTVPNLVPMPSRTQRATSSVTETEPTPTTERNTNV